MFTTRFSGAPLLVAIVAIALWCGGCARYEYAIVSPPDVARHIGGDRDTVIGLLPLEYRFRSVDNYLVMRVFNPTREPVRLLGQESFVVDPHRQSHPLRGQTIAPGTYIKLIFPPPRPQLEPAGPSIGIGFGARYGYGSYRHGYWARDPFYDPYWDVPRYYTVYDGDAMYWDWSGESDVRVAMVYQQADRKPFTHEWVFRRKRV